MLEFHKKKHDIPGGVLQTDLDKFQISNKTFGCWKDGD